MIFMMLNCQVMNRMHILSHEKQIFEYEQTLASIKKQNNVWSQDEVKNLEKKLHSLKKKVYSELKPWDRIGICRHPARPHTADFIINLSDEFVEVFGDRYFGDDRALIAGFSKINKIKFAIVGLEKGKDTESRLNRNFGMAHPEGYRKALRVMKLAEKFDIPIICFLDTPGAYPGLSAEERGQGWAIAKNLWEMARIRVPIIIVLIGEGCSGGALGIGVGDRIGMLEHAYYSVISPEGCASILWKDPTKNATAAEALKMHAEDLLELDIVDHIIKEPLGGAHHNPLVVYENVKKFIIDSFVFLKDISRDELLQMRYQKFRNMGKFVSS